MGILEAANTATLVAALMSAAPGDTVALQPGVYDPVVVRNLQPAGEVRVVSADPGRPAVLRGLTLNGVANVTFDGVHFDYVAAPNPNQSHRPFALRQSRNIRIANAVFDGDRARSQKPHENGYGTGIGLLVDGGRDITVEDSRFFEFYRGAFFTRVDGLTLRGNEVRAMRSDGFNFADADNVVIEGNLFRDFRTSPQSRDHPDMIQFWTTNTDTPSERVAIRRNRFDMGQGAPTQTIFFGNEAVRKGGGRAMFYRDVEISGNAVHNAHLHGITIGQAIGVTISKNTLISAAERPEKSTQPAIRVSGNSERVTITDNISHGVFGQQRGWTVRRNLTVQTTRPVRADYYKKIEVRVR